jgi:1D-myo-inositol 3-kinase
VILLAGNYCHDLIVGKDGTQTRTLGGSAAYAAAILDAFGEPFAVASRVGADFGYASEVSHAARVVAGPTTSFVDDYSEPERRERVEAICEPLSAGDLPEGPFDVGLALGIAGEVTLPVLARMREICRLVLADAQSLLREIGPSGEVLLRQPAPPVLRHLDWLKASRAEAAHLDVPSLLQRVNLIVTDGARGCTVLTASSKEHVPAVPAVVELDPTGAGDCFLAGFALAISRALPPRHAAALGSWCGARAVEHFGVPRLSVTQAAAARRRFGVDG